MGTALSLSACQMGSFASSFKGHKAGDEAARSRFALERAAGNRGRAAQSLGISRATLWRRMRALGMDD